MKLHQDIAFCTSADGTRIATAACGAGPVILRAAHWLSHVAYDLDSPVWRPWVEALSRRHRFVRYDPRGCGMSERHCRRPVARRVAPGPRGRRRDDPGRPVRSARVSRKAVRWRSTSRSGIPSASRISSSSTPMRRAAGPGPATTPSAWRPRRWSISSASAGVARTPPSASSSPTSSFRAAQRSSIAGGATWSAKRHRRRSPRETLRQMQGIDVLDLCAQVRVPTLVLSCRGDMRVPFEQGAGLRPRSRARGSCRSTAPTTCFCRTSRPGRRSTPNSAAFLGDDGACRPRAAAGRADRRRSRQCCASWRRGSTTGPSPAGSARARRPCATRCRSCCRSSACRAGRRRSCARWGLEPRPRDIRPIARSGRTWGGRLMRGRRRTRQTCLLRRWGRDRRIDRCHWTKRRLNEFVGQVLGDLGGAVSVPLVRIGDALGLYAHARPDRPGDARGPRRRGRLPSALRARMARRRRRPRATSPTTDGRFSLSPEQAFVFAAPDSPVNLIGAFDTAAAMVENQAKVQAAFKTGKRRRLGRSGGLPVLRRGAAVPAGLCQCAGAGLAAGARRRRRPAEGGSDGRRRRLRPRGLDDPDGAGVPEVRLHPATTSTPARSRRRPRTRSAHGVTNVRFEVGRAQDFPGETSTSSPASTACTTWAIRRRRRRISARR